MSRVDRVTLAALAVPLAVAGGLAALYALGVLGAPTAVRSGFALVAALVALVVFRLTRNGAPLDGSPMVSGPNSTRLVLALGAAAVLATALTGERLLPVLGALVPGYLLVAAQLARENPPVRSTLASLAVLVAVPAVAKYLTTDVFFAGTDTFAHIEALRRLFETNYTTALPHGYDLFPVFHLVVGAVSRFGGLPAYDAILLTGVAVTVTAVPAAYLVAARVLGDTRLALCVATAIALSEFVAYHALYFFPQALAIGLLLVGLSAAAAIPAAARAVTVRRHAAYLLALVGVLVLTHHLTYVLFAVPLVVLLAAVGLRAKLASRFKTLAAPPSALVRAPYRTSFPLVVGLLALLAYLVFSPSLILFGIGVATYDILLGTGAPGGPTTFLFGLVPPADSLARAVEWLLTPTGVYYSSLAAVLLVGVYAFLGNVREYARVGPLIVVGAGLAAVLFPLPVDIPQVERLQFTLTLFAAVPVGLGVAHALRTSARSRRVAVVGIVLIAALGTATPLTRLAAADIDEVYLDERGAQTTMSDAEYAALDSTAGFLDARTSGPVTTDYIGQRALASVGWPTDPDGSGLAVSEGGLSAPPGYLLVRAPWTTHYVPVMARRGLVSEDVRWFTTVSPRYERTLAVNDRVRDAGPVSVLASSDGYEGVLGNTSG